jgi:hypothetical protein
MVKSLHAISNWSQYNRSLVKRGSLFVPLCVPDYSCVNNRASTVKVVYRQPPKGKVTDLVIDSTGLKVFG